MTLEQQKKVASCKALQGKSIADVVRMPEFLQNLGAYMRAQFEERKAARASYEKIKPFAKGFKLPAHAIDKVMDLTPEQFADEYLAVINGDCQRPAAVREYIAQLGQQAYNMTIASIVVAEFPELKDEFVPPAKRS